MKKFELTSEFICFFGRKLFRIKALIDFLDIKAGDLGGYVEKEENLEHDGNAWVCGNAKVYGNARVYGNAKVYGNARVCGDARVYGNAEVCGNAKVYGNARVYGNAWVCGDAKVCGNAWVCGNAEVYGDAKVCGNAWVCGNAEVYGDAKVCGDADYTTVKGFGSIFRTTTFFRLKNGEIGVKCGCFFGTLFDFRKKVKSTHKESTIAKEYLMLADLMEYHFKERKNNE